MVQDGIGYQWAVVLFRRIVRCGESGMAEFLDFDDGYSWRVRLDFVEQRERPYPDAQDIREYGFHAGGAFPIDS